MLLINTEHEDDVQINVEMIDRGFADVSAEPIKVGNQWFLFQIDTILIIFMITISGLNDNRK